MILRIDIINHIVRTCRCNARITVDVGVTSSKRKCIGPIFGIGKGRREGSSPGDVVATGHCRERPRCTTLSWSVIQVWNSDVGSTGEASNRLTEYQSYGRVISDQRDGRVINDPEKSIR